MAAQDRAAPGAHEALAGLCTAYWYPLYAFIRRKGRGPEDALDLTQDYFARLLERGTISRGRRVQGPVSARFYWPTARASWPIEMRGTGPRSGVAARCSFQLTCEMPRAATSASHRMTGHRRGSSSATGPWPCWTGVLARLRGEYEDTGRGAAFEAMKVLPTHSPRAVTYATLAQRLDSTEGAVQVAVHRLRRRYRDLVRAAIAVTVDDAADVEDEVRDLFAALCD